MEGLGLRLRSGRTTHYLRVIHDWLDQRRTPSAQGARNSFPNLVSSFFEIEDFISIHRAFGSIAETNLSSVIEKLRRAVNGPIDAAQETPTSTIARNLLFEVVVAALAHRPGKGVEAILDAQSDTGIRLGGETLWVECKRVTRIEKIEANTRIASTQLQSRLSAEQAAGNRGIVALDVSRILNRGGDIYVSKRDHELIANAEGMMEDFIRRHSPVWQRVYQRRPSTVIGTILRFSFMAFLEDRNILVRSSEWAVNPRLGCAAADEDIQRRLVSALASNFPR